MHTKERNFESTWITSIKIILNIIIIIAIFKHVDFVKNKKAINEVRASSIVMLERVIQITFCKGTIKVKNKRRAYCF